MGTAYDLIIIGGGGAGLSAAWYALEGGLKKIIVFESTKKTGGFSAMAGGFIYAVETEQLKKKGGGPTVTQALKDHLNFHHYDFIEPGLLRHWLEETKNTIKWMEDMGYPFILTNMGTGASHLIENSTGVNYFWTFLTPLMEKLKERGVEIVTTTTVLGIEKDKKGRAAGVTAVKENGKDEQFQVSGKNILIATGGFMSREDLMDKYFATYYNKKALFPRLKNRGNGIEVALSAGAKVNPVCTLIKENGRHGEAGTVFVNSEGCRYQDESLWHNNYSANALLRQPGMMGYAIYSSEVLKSLANQPFNPLGTGDKKAAQEPPKPADDEMPMMRDKNIRCKTVGEMAKFIGCKVEVLQKTVDDYNSYCKDGIDREMGKDAKYLKPLSGPWMVAEIKPMYVDTIGPVNTDEDLRVLDNERNVIPGLYAAGTIVGGWVGHDYMQFGSALSWAMTSGRIAGMTIGKDYKVKN
jgi:fumarate reductase flavoprotein subunit